MANNPAQTKIVEAMVRDTERRIVWALILHARMSSGGSNALQSADEGLKEYEKRFPPLRDEGA